MVVIYAKQPKPVLFALNNQYLEKSYISLPIDDPTSILELHCPSLGKSQAVKKSYFQLITEGQNSRRQVWNYYSADGSQASKKLHSVFTLNSKFNK